ncbi:MAG TPA: PAS domain S-box protein [Bacillota bacterium]|nr:PAS domain S-box protein [Bacillota bacterium]
MSPLNDKLMLLTLLLLLVTLYIAIQHNFQSNVVVQTAAFIILCLSFAFCLYHVNKKVRRRGNAGSLEEKVTFPVDFFNILPAGVFILDNTGAVAYANEYFYKITGFNSNIIGESFENLVEKVFLEPGHKNYPLSKIIEERPYIRGKNIVLKSNDGILVSACLNLMPLGYSGGTEVMGIVSEITSQTELLELKQKFSFFLGNTGSSVIAVDRNFRITLFNNAAEELFSIKKEAVLGRHVAEVFNDYEIENHPVIKTLVTGEEIRNQEVPIFLNGQLRTLLFDTGLIKNDAGEVTGAVGVCTDVSEKKRIEEDLKNTIIAYSKEKSYMRNVLNNLPEAIISYDKDLHPIYMNSMAETLIGINYGWLNYRVAGSGVKNGDLFRYLAEDVFKSRKPIFGVQRMLTTSEGKTMPFSIDVHPLYNEIKQNNGVMVIARDITEKRAHEKLMYLSSCILDSLSSAVVSIDSDYNIIVFNPPAERLFRYTADKVIGKNINDIPPFLEGERFLQTTLESCWGIQFLETSFRVNGEDIILLVNTNVIRDREDNVIGAVAVFQDITELRRTQNAVREKERLAIIGQMAAGMAHEIKNPLTAVRGFAQLLGEKCPENSTLVNYVKIIMNEIDQASSVITSFLQLARPKQPVLIRQSANSLVDEILLIVGPQAFLKKIKVECEKEENLPQCKLDGDQIKQVMLNMCQNAIEAMPETGGVLKITTGILPANNEIYIEISDTGCGIPREKIEKIGVPFYTTKADGTGLGLSISYAIVGAHNGRVEVESEEGKGTTFRILLPF